MTQIFLRSTASQDVGSISLRQFLTALCLLTLPNIVFWWTAYYFGYQRPVLNLDYGLAFAFWCFGWRWAGYVTALLALAIDVLAGAAQVYLLFDPGQLLQLLAFAQQARPGFLVFFICLLVLNSCFYGFTAWALKKKKATAKALLCALAPFVLLNIAPMLAELNSQQANLQLDRRIVVLGSQTDILHRVFFRSDIGHHLAETTEEKPAFTTWPELTATEQSWGKGRPLPKRLLLVLVESWGVPRNEKELTYQLNTLLRSGIEPVNSGSIKQTGGTIAGELRELCKLASSKIYFDDLGAAATECWPYRLQQEGYVTTAIHAASSSMYRRNEWYPSIGFKHNHFMQNYPKQARRCYSFPGLCDVELASFVADTLTVNEKSFVYWMTLNSHLPYDKRDLQKPPSTDCTVLGLKEESQRCVHYSLIQELFASLADVLVQPKLQGTEVVLVGDHQPPFFNMTDRDAFLPGAVPFIHIRITTKGDSQKAN